MLKKHFLPVLLYAGVNTPMSNASQKDKPRVPELSVNVQLDTLDDVREFAGEGSGWPLLLAQHNI